MAEQAHTPGPWSVAIDDPSGIGRTSAVYICNTQGWPEGQLARVNVQDGLDEQKANARLIAAAPDLLAALRAYCDLSDSSKDVDVERVWAMRDAAIARAEGGAS